MAYDVIARLQDPTIASKLEVITYLIKRAEKKKSNEEFKDSILDYLYKNEKIPQTDNYCLIGSKHALGCLLGHFLYHYISEKNFKKQITLLKSLSKYLKEFQPSERALLKKTAAVKLIDAIKKFGLPGYFLRAFNNRPLRIYFIPHQHIKFNAGYLPFLNSIVSYRPKENASSAEYIFVHEIGHLLIFNLTGDPGKVPDSFIEFNNKFNPSWKGDLVEVFVDLFSIAIMMDTEFASKNPFLKTFEVKSQQIIKDYFNDLIKSLKNKNVKSWFGDFEY
jgi:hypothetical protein